MNVHCMNSQFQAHLRKLQGNIEREISLERSNVSEWYNINTKMDRNSAHQKEPKNILTERKEEIWEDKYSRCPATCRLAAII